MQIAVRFSIVAMEFPPLQGGIATLTQDYARFLAKRWPVTVYLIGRTLRPAQIEMDGVIVKYLGFKAFDALYTELRKDRITHVLFNHFLCSSFKLLARLKLCGIKSCTLLHGMDMRSTPPMRMGFKNTRIPHRLRMYLSFLLQTAVVPNSRFTQEEFREKFPGLRSRIIHPGIWMDEEEAVLPVKKDQKSIVAIGRLIKRKGVHSLLEAMARMDHVPETVIIGDGPDRVEFEELKESLNLGEKVRFLGGLPHNEVMAELKKHDIFCLLPREIPGGDVEGFGIVFLEAAANGLPVVAGNSGGVSDAVNDGVNGFLVDPERPQEVAERLMQLLTNDNLHRQMSMASVEWAKKFDWNRRDPEREFSFLLNS